MIKIEVCVESIEDALSAQNAGADRLEVSSCLSLGGLTPSIGLMRIINKEIKIPIVPLIRERSGNFTYSSKEKLTMLKSVEGLMKYNCQGFVIGALNNEGNIDLDFLIELISNFPCQELTFHRAFDYCKNPLAEIRKLEEIGIKRVLTSGQESDIIKGAKLIKDLINQCKSISIMPGGGITPENVKELVDLTGVKEIHTSASLEYEVSKNYYNKALGMGDFSRRKKFCKKRFLEIKQNIRGE